MTVTVQLKTSARVIQAFIAVLSCGMALVPLLFFVLPYYPARLDEDGMTLRSGKRVRWSDLTKCHRRTVTLGGARVTGILTMWFGIQKVLIAPMAITPSEEVVAFVYAKTGLLPG